MHLNPYVKQWLIVLCFVAVLAAVVLTAAVCGGESDTQPYVIETRIVPAIGSVTPPPSTATPESTATPQPTATPVAQTPLENHATWTAVLATTVAVQPAVNAFYDKNDPDYGGITVDLNNELLTAVQEAEAINLRSEAEILRT